MEFTVEKSLHNIADYIEYHCSFNVRTKYKTRKTRFQAALYLYYVLADEHTNANHAEIGEIVDRDRSTVSIALARHSNYAKEYYPHVYNRFNPFKANVETIDNPFHPTLDILYKAKEQLEKDIAFIRDEESYTHFYMLRQVRNQKALEILKMIHGLDKNTLDVILERLPPIIKMAQSIN